MSATGKRPLGRERRMALAMLAQGGELFVYVDPIPVLCPRPIPDIGSGWIAGDGRHRVSAATVDWLSRDGWTGWDETRKCRVLRTERRDLAAAVAAGRDVLLIGAGA